jgi:competence protein ComEC
MAASSHPGLRGCLAQFCCRSVRAAGALLLPLLLAVTPHAAFAEQVTPSERVERSVVIRSAPSARSEPIGALFPGDSLEVVDDDIPHWYVVRLPDGRTGYVSKNWTVPVPGLAAADVPAGGFLIHSIDVGTGLAVLIEGPDFTLLYDGGSNDDLARGPSNRVTAYLRKVRPNLRRIDHLILSHPHRDHVELLPDVLGAYEVRHVWDSGRYNPICGYRAFLERVADEPGVTYHNAVPGSGPHEVELEERRCYGTAMPRRTLRIPSERISSAPVSLGANARMTFLHADGGRHSSPNENSLVVRVDLADRRVLLMGDAEGGERRDWSDEPAPEPDSVEGHLLDCCADALKADILFAGHHGSRTSSRRTFLDSVDADHYVISSGPVRYGSVTLPDAVIVEELDRRGTVWRTDVADASCAASSAKIGPDNDGKAGGCDNVRFAVHPTGRIDGHYARIAD